MIIVIEAPFVSILVHIVISIKFRPHTLRGTELVNVHEDLPREVNKVFVSHHQIQEEVAQIHKDLQDLQGVLDYQW
jgi:hypothetical protein